MPTGSDFRTHNVTEIRTQGTAKKASFPETQVQNPPTARELSQNGNSFKHRPSNQEELFEAIFRNMDDDIFQELLELIEKGRLALLYGDSDIVDESGQLRATKPPSEIT